MISLPIQKCVCGHDMLERDGAAKHAHVQDGHRFFTQHCQDCLHGGKKCDRPAAAAPRVTLVGSKGDHDQEGHKDDEKHDLACRYCPETFQDRTQLMRHTKAVKHAFPVDRLKEVLTGPRKTQAEIAKELGLPQSTVSRWISILKAQGPEGDHEEPQEPGSRTPKSGGVNPGPREEVKTRVDQLETENVQLKEALKESEEKIRTLTDTLAARAVSRTDGILRSRIEVTFYDGYYDHQRRLITESIKEEVYHAAKGRSIVMESKVLDGDTRRIIIEISGGEQL